MEEKKRKKGGADYLREKFVALEREHKMVVSERDTWKKVYEDKLKDYRELNNEHNKTLGKLRDAEERLAFLLEQCPFWVRWSYESAFEGK